MESNGGESDTAINKESDDEESNNEEFEEFLDDKLARPKRSNSSLAWEFFDVKDSKHRVATCKLCSCDCSYWSSVSNLMKHVRRKHFVHITNQLDRSSNPHTKQHSLRDTIHSSIWNYYKKLDLIEKLAMCLVCKKQLSYKSSTSNLKKHLNRKHPNLKFENDDKRVILSSDGKLYEIEETKSEHLQKDDDDDDLEDQPTLDINSVFIDDFEDDYVERRNKKRKLEREEKKHRKVILEDTGHSDASTSSDEITFQKRYVRKKNDSLNQFGKYLISLMKQLPKELSSQLQIDFLKQVMTAKLTYDTQQQQKGSDSSNGYAISITDNGLQSTRNQPYLVEEHVVETH
ncbi:uncharacterized protein LOC128678692 isoform X2 [Plodia interpunctella]|uniref:uncharacterized protein LOC128678692 isoform X2 n=1 Tax=Plodia interpunctella TaxID=58824 RepID=UPI002368961D|nr:uncharacterized protein LOC128678692 isoform X2 [Plodia interpunctella]